ncbi:hypothetical protein M422DRAFT_33561, partial [Sphaerobolus stellatus SS14]
MGRWGLRRWSDVACAVIVQPPYMLAMQDLKNVANVNSVDPTLTARPSGNASTPSAATTKPTPSCSPTTKGGSSASSTTTLREGLSAFADTKPNVIQGAM